MNVKKIILLTLSIVMLASLTVAVASAGTAISVGHIWADSQLNDPTAQHSISQAYVGQTVYVYWNTVLPPSGTVDINVYVFDANWQLVSTIPVGTGFVPTDSGTTPASFVVPNVPGGICQITLNGMIQIIPIASVTIFVLPESAFGALAAIGAGFAAFGSLVVAKKGFLKR
jgi:hypothetical protein